METLKGDAGPPGVPGTVTQATVGSVLLASKVSGDTYPRFQINQDGEILRGDGTVAPSRFLGNTASSNPGRIWTDYFAGYKAGQAWAPTSASAYANTGVGYLALQSLVGNAAVGGYGFGEGNVGVGYNAGGNLTNGDRNVCVGVQAGQGLVTGHGNVYLGYHTGETASPTQTLTVAIGYFAGGAATASGTFIGGNAGQNVTGVACTYIGNGSGALTTTGQYSTFVGAGAAGGAVLTGSANTGFGFNAGNLLTSGAYNNLVGYSAGSKITTGQKNIVIGSNANNITTGSSNIVIGDSVAVPDPTATGQLALYSAITGTAIHTAAPAVGLSTATGKLGFFGTTPVVRPASTPAAATDAATTQALANSLRVSLLALGLVA